MRRSPRRRWLLLVVLVPLALVDWRGIGEWVLVGRTEALVAGFDIAIARWDRFPGPKLRVPPQPCPSCQRGEHTRCSQRTGRLDLCVRAVDPWQLNGNYSMVVAGPTERRTAEDGSELAVGKSARILDFENSHLELSSESFQCPCCNP